MGTRQERNIYQGCYGTSAKSSAWVTVPLLSGNYDRSMQVPMQSTFAAPLDDSKRTKIRTGMGVYNYSGNMSFEMSTELVPVLINENMFKRLSFLDIEMSDGYVPSHPHARSQESKIFGRVFLPLNASGRIFRL